MISSKPPATFHDAASAVLRHLHDDLGFDLWMITRTEADDWIVLQAADRGYGVQQGDVFRWTDSFCSRMVQGLGPRIAPRSQDVPAYVEAPIGRQVPIGAYIGVPLNHDDGRLFGTMCAIHPTPRPHWITQRLKQVELLGGLLSTILQLEIRATEETRRAERAQMEAMTDCLTGLYNRRGWDRLLEAEQARYQRYGHPTCLMSIDIDLLKTVNDTQGHAAGDALIQRTGEAIQSCLRAQDVAARLGGDEFAVMAVDCEPQSANVLIRRLQQAFAAHRVQASVGAIMCQPNQSFPDTWKIADDRMYKAKHPVAVCNVR